PGDVCWDVGSFYGYYALVMAKRAGPAGRVYAFEPSGANRSRMLAAVARNPALNVEVKNWALGAANGPGRLEFTNVIPRQHVSDDSQARLARPDSGTNGSPAEAVEVRSVDTLVDEGLARPDFVKIDVEGHEGDV